MLILRLTSRTYLCSRARVWRELRLPSRLEPALDPRSPGASATEGEAPVRNVGPQGRHQQDDALRGDDRDVHNLNEERQRHGVDAQRDKVHGPEPQQVAPPVALHPEYEPPLQHVGLEDAQHVRDPEDHEVVDGLPDRQLERDEHAVGEGRVHHPHQPVAHDLEPEQRAHPRPGAPAHRCVDGGGVAARPIVQGACSVVRCDEGAPHRPIRRRTTKFGRCLTSSYTRPTYSLRMPIMENRMPKRSSNSPTRAVAAPLRHPVLHDRHPERIRGPGVRRGQAAAELRRAPSDWSVRGALITPDHGASALDDGPGSDTAPVDAAVRGGPRARVRALLGFEIVRYGLVGVVNTAFAYSVFIALELTIGKTVHYLVILGISHVLGVLEAYVLQRWLVFRVQGHWWRDLLRFWSVYLVSLGINAVALPLLVEVVHVPVIPAQGVILLVSALGTYVAHRSFTFRRAGTRGSGVESGLQP